MILLHACDVARSQAVGTNGRRQLATVQTAVPCTFVPMSAKSSIDHNFAVGFGWDIYFDDGADIRSGDRLSWNGGTYIVSGTQPFIGFPGVSHVRVAAETEHGNVQ